MNVRLEDMIEATRASLDRRQRERPLSELEREVGAPREGRPFAEALSRPGTSLIAEHKRRSPSAGAIREGAECAELVRAYERGGAAAISVLTEEAHFGGSLADLREARATTELPLLRKDFTIDEWQLWESRAAGADAVLLIVAVLEPALLRDLLAGARGLGLGALVEALGRPTLLALTATASPPVRAEIAERLGMRDPELIVRGFDRPNLRLAVKNDRDPGRKRAALVERAAELGGPGIVYVATRRLTEELAAELRDAGLRTAPYHAGLARRARDETQAEFMDGRLDAVIATTAFGMGVDKPDVRFVLHHDPSDSLDSYWQEIGRAGRNGEPAEAMLFWREHDLGLRRFFAAGAVDGETVARVAERMANESRPVEPQRLREELELGDTKIASALSRLEEAGAVELRPDGRVRSLAVEPDQVERAMEAAEERRAFDRSRLEMMRAYAEHDRCRREFVLSYFGEPYEGPCGHCDNCEAGRGAAEDGAEPFVRGARVEHREWGEGVVQRYDGDEMSVLFDSVGYRTLSLQLVEERNLLRESS